MRVDIGRELRWLAAAFATLTRLPVPICPGEPLPADWLARSAKYFPLAGIVVGGLSAVMLVGAAQLWPAPVPALLAVATALLATGALHEDGLADTADSLGGRTREQRLAIMKDPRLGSFGALALGLVLALRIAALSCLPILEGAAALVAGAAAARFAVLPVMARAPYAGDRALAKLDHGIEGPSPSEIAVGAVLAVIPFLALDLDRAVFGLGLGVLVSISAAVWLCRPLGGYTGDVLGAVVALTETAFLLGAAARWA